MKEKLFELTDDFYTGDKSLSLALSVHRVKWKELEKFISYQQRQKWRRWADNEIQFRQLREKISKTNYRSQKIAL